MPTRREQRVLDRKRRERNAKRREQYAMEGADEPVPSHVEALQEMILKYVSTVNPKSADELANDVRDDWGAITKRQIYRHLSVLKSSNKIKALDGVYWKGDRLSAWEVSEIASDKRAEQIGTAFARNPWERKGTISGSLRGGALKTKQARLAKAKVTQCDVTVSTQVSQAGGGT